MSTVDRLRRAKSTKSIRKGHGTSRVTESFDPGIARLHATTAASLAMSRSTDRGSTISEGSYGFLGGPRTMAVPQRKHRSTISIRNSDNSSAADESPLNQIDLLPAETNDDDQSCSAALPSISEFGGLEPGIATLPSSYRRLRRTRSMLPTRQRSSHISYGSSPDNSSPTAGRAPVPDTPKSFRSLRRSMSFLRGDNKFPSTLQHARSHDVAMGLARSQYQQNILDYENTALPPLPVSGARRAHKPFRKTFRATSASRQDTEGTSPPTERLKYTSYHGKTRSFSSSIRKGLKRVLGLSKSLPEPTSKQRLPRQSWSKDHFVTQARSEDSGRTKSHDNQDYNQGETRPGLYRPPTVRSKQSRESLTTARSRVTSWADSTAANTIGTPKSGRQKLSIIDEQYGPSQAHPGNYRSDVATPQRPSESIDSQRLFSALMKRIGRNGTQSSYEDIVLGRVEEHRAIHTEGLLHPQSSRQTIRQIPSNESITSPKSFSTANTGMITPQRQTRYPEQQHYLFHGTGPPNQAPQNDSKGASVCKAESENDSSSVYSRTPSGHSPKLPTDSPEPEEELGVATIFASQRTAYSSPNRASTSSGPDWQHWMDSQMERIEKLTPTKHHYREDAQIQDDYDTGLSQSIPPRKMRALNRTKEPVERSRDTLMRKISTSSNFSRPFSRSSSVRTIIVSSKECSDSPPVSPAQAPQPVSKRPTGQGYSLSSTGTRINNPSMSPMQSRLSNKIRALESPTPKRDTIDASPNMHIRTYEPHSTRWPLVTHDGEATQLRTSRIQRNGRMAVNENSKVEMNRYHQARDLQSPISSKRMVEMFLNSRRRQLGTQISEDESSEGAFI